MTPCATPPTKILDTLGRGPFIFNLGHGIVPETPPEHVGELVEAGPGVETVSTGVDTGERPETRR